MAARYSAPLADLRFALYDVLDAEALFARLPGYETATRDVLDAVLDEAAQFTEPVLAPLNSVGDQDGCNFDKASGERDHAARLQAGVPAVRRRRLDRADRRRRNSAARACRSCSACRSRK